MTDNPRRVKLKGGMKHSSHTIEIKEDGTLVAELYDFSDMAEQSVGGDIAWVITVQKETVPQVTSLLQQDTLLKPHFTGTASEANDNMLSLLPVLPLRFARYYDFKEWLQANGVPFKEFTDTWA